MAKLVVVEVAELKAMTGRMSKSRKLIIDEISKQLTGYGRLLVKELKQEAPVDQAVLQRSIRFQVKGKGTKNAELIVTAGNKQRPVVVIKTILFGSKPHIIKPKRPGYPLRWYDKGTGAARFAYSVRHPGTNANNFMERALNNTENERDKMMQDVGKITVRKILSAKE